MSPFTFNWPRVPQTFATSKGMRTKTQLRREAMRSRRAWNDFAEAGMLLLAHWHDCGSADWRKEHVRRHPGADVCIHHFETGLAEYGFELLDMIADGLVAPIVHVLLALLQLRVGLAGLDGAHQRF